MKHLNEEHRNWSLNIVTRHAFRAHICELKSSYFGELQTRNKEANIQCIHGFDVAPQFKGACAACNSKLFQVRLDVFQIALASNALS